MKPLRRSRAASEPVEPTSPARPTADVERLMGQMREANERLLISAVKAQNRSEQADVATALARTELEALMRQLGEAHARLADASIHAHTMAEEAGQREHEYQQLSGRLLTLQDEERRRLALDLHDSTGQILAALLMNLDVVAEEAQALGARSRRALEESRSLANRCSRDVRTFAYLLHPPLLDEAGLLPALRWFVEGFSRRSGIEVTMDLGQAGRLPTIVETALFRVVQESLTNAHRHALTSTASIRLSSTADEVVLDIHDRGRGRPSPPVAQSGPQHASLGVGIQGMRERIRQLGGVLEIDFTATGTSVRVSVPLRRHGR
jgi:two-component system NarL family sensor kinase